MKTNVAKKLARICVLCLLATMLFGCQQPKPTTTANSPANAPTSAPLVEGEVESWDIDYVSAFTDGEPYTVWLKAVAEKYTSQTGGTVNFSWVGRDSLTQIRTRLLTDDAPDIVDHNSSELFAALLNNGESLLATDLSDAPFLNAFDENILGLYAQDNKTYIIPYIFNASGFFYNKALFSELGIDAPSTMDEFLAAAQASAAAGKPMIGADNISLYNAYYFYWACQRIMGSGAFYAAASDASGETWNNPGYLEAAKLVEALLPHFQPDYSGYTWPAAQSAFALGDMSTLLCGTWIPTELSSMVDDNFEWGFFTFPTVAGGIGLSTDMEADPIAWAVPSGSKNPEGAKKFIEIACSMEMANQIAPLTNNMPAVKGAQLPADLADAQTYIDNATEYHKIYDGVAADHPEWWANVFYPANDAFMAGQLSAEGFIAKLQNDSVSFYQ